jgi:hypothetical protein
MAWADVSDLTDLHTGASDSGGSVTIPNASFKGEGLAVGESTNDWRELVLSFLDNVYETYTGLPNEDRPTKLTISKSGNLQTDGSLQYSYSVRISVEPSAVTVADEPVA